MAKRQPARKRQVERRLTQLERRLIGELQRRMANVRHTSADDPTEFLDLVCDGEMDFMSAVSAEMGCDTVREIQDALAKVREGTYGTCDDCGKRIAKRRLEARPFATRCIACKERMERRSLAAAGRTYARGTVEVSLDDLTGEEQPEAQGTMDGLLREVEDLELNGMF